MDRENRTDTVQEQRSATEWWHQGLSHWETSDLKEPPKALGWGQSHFQGYSFKCSQLSLWCQGIDREWKARWVSNLPVPVGFTPQLPPAPCPAKPRQSLFTIKCQVSHTTWWMQSAIRPVSVCLSFSLVMMRQFGSYSLYYWCVCHPQITLHMANEGKHPNLKYQVQFPLNYTAVTEQENCNMEPL